MIVKRAKANAFLSMSSESNKKTIIFVIKRKLGAKHLRETYSFNCSETNIKLYLQMVFKFKFVRHGHINFDEPPMLEVSNFQTEMLQIG